MAADSLTSTTFGDKMINGGINFIKYFHGKSSSSSGSTVSQSIKFLRWWCNCKPSNTIQLPLESTTVAENVTYGLEETIEAVKHIVENISETLHDAVTEPIIDKNTQTLLSTLIKLGVILLFIGCVLYVLSGIKRKISNYRTNSGITDTKTKMTSLVISRNQSFQEDGGDLFFKQQKLQNNSLTVLTPIVSQKKSPFTPVNSKEMGKRPPNSKEKLLQKASSPTQKKNEMLIVAPICTSPGNKTDPTQRDASSPARTDRTQNASSPARTDPTQRDASSPARTDPTQRDASSPARTDTTQKSSSPTNNNNTNGHSSSFSPLQPPEIRHNKT